MFGGGGMSFDAGGHFSDSIMVRYSLYLRVTSARLPQTGTGVPTGYLSHGTNIVPCGA